ncbi:MAG: M14 metallopeptidase family protein [Acidobacteriota bacterium]
MNSTRRFQFDRVFAILLAAWLCAAAALGSGAAEERADAAIPPPSQVTGFEIGQDYKLADYSMMQEYFRLLDERSDRFKVVEYGKSAQGRPMLMAIVTSPQNHRKLERYREISRRLALGQVASDEEAKSLAQEGKAVVWLDAGLHATEIAHAQHAFKLGYQLASRDDEEMQRILDNVVLLFTPCINPDGMDMVTGWYRDHQDLRIPDLYQHYVGHDNNRDFIMLSQAETQAMARIMYREWIPQIVYNHHQQAPRGTAIFVPEFRGPFNFNIDPMVMRGINLVSAAMKMRFEEENKPGVISRETYSTWWNGGLRTAAYFHNQIGILTETGIADPAPRKILPRPERLQPSTDYPNPLQERMWHLSDSIDYMMTGSWAVLDVASRYPERFLHNIYLAGKRSIERGRSQAPYAFVLPSDQSDAGTVRRLVNVLIRSGLQVHRLKSASKVGSREYPEGSFVIRSDQAFRPHLMDLMTPQAHPDQVQYPGGPPVPPYDIAGWTLSYQMGVESDTVDVPLDPSLDTALERIEEELRPSPGQVPPGEVYAYLLSPAPNDAYAAVSRLLQDGEQVYRLTKNVQLEEASYPAGTFLVPVGEATRGRIEQLASQRGLDFAALQQKPSEEVKLVQLSAPRIGMYDIYGGNMDEGWTRWIFEKFDMPHHKLWGQEIRAGGLSEKFDVIVLPSGIRIGTERRSSRRRRRGRSGPLPEGFEERMAMGKEGVEEIRNFVEQGGTLITLGGSSMMAIRDLGLPLRNVLMKKTDEGGYQALPRTEFYCPGSVLEVEFEPSHPIAYGMPVAGSVFFRHSPTFELLPAAMDRVSIPATYPDRNPLQSGWIWGEAALFGQAALAEVAMGKGRVILLGPRVQFRYQPHSTFKLLFNSVLLGASKESKLP